MHPAVREKIKEWYILAIALCVVFGGLAFASRETPTTAGARGPQLSGTVAGPKPQPAASNPQNTVATPNPNPPSASSQAPAAATPAPITPDHMAANPPQPPSAAATNAQARSAVPTQSVTAGDPAAGRLVFRKCQVCHSMEPGKNLLGPSLAGIMGRKAGTNLATITRSR